MRNLVTSVIRHTVFANVVLIILFLAAFIAFANLLREQFPEFSMDVLTITVAYPGADPEEVEEGIVRKIEEEIDGLEGIKRYVSISSENSARLNVTIDEGYDTDKVKEEVRSAIDSISTFPVDAEKPILSEMTMRSEVITLALAGPMPEKTRKEFAEQIKDELQQIDGLSQVEIMGVREYEIGIEVSEERLREYGLTIDDVSEAVRRGSVNLSAGVMRTKGEELLVRTVGRKYTGEELASIVVLARPNGELITLDRIAAIRDGFTEDPVRSSFNGEDAVMIEVYKTTEEDAIAVAEAVRKYAAEKEPTLPAGVTLTVWADFSKEINARLNLLTKNGALGLLLVFLSLWLFLELRLSFWVAMGIPISLGGALILLWLLGGTLNQLSLFGMIMVLGIIVDDAIVVGESVYVHRRRGEPSLQAAASGVMEVGLPVLAAVTTTIVAFLPLAFVSGMMGKFIGIIPVVVISALAVSLFEALFLLPAHLTHLRDPNAEVDPSHPIQRRAARMRKRISQALERFVDNVYLPFLRLALRRRYVSMSVAVAVLFFTVGLANGGFVKYIMFPQLDSNDLQANVEFPMGTPFHVTDAALVKTRAAIDRVANRIEEEKGKDYIANVYATVGLTKAGFGEGYAAPSGGHTGMIRVELIPNDQRDLHAQEILARWEEEMGPVPGALSQTFDAVEQGPPGAAIEMWIRGHELDTLRTVAEEVKAKLRTYDGVRQVQDDFRPGKREIRLDLKPEARALGITLDDLARQVYGGYFGQEALRLQRGRDDVRVRVRYTEDERKTLADLEQVRIRTPQGNEVPFFSVADVRFDRSPSSINREGGARRVIVTAEVVDGRANPQEVINDLRETTMPGLLAAYPNFSYSFEGRQEESRDALGSLFIGFPVAIVGIFVILATIFRSYVQPFVILATVPFGIIGAVLGHVIMGYPLSLMSIFGMVALTGVVVNDAIILIEAVNTQISRGVSVFEAIIAGGRRRFRPILLTTLSTVGGLTPLLLERDNQAKFLIPMAISVAAGVAFATLLTLVLIPCLLGVLNDFRRLAHYFRTGEWPAEDEVEPARERTIPGQEGGMPLPEPAPVYTK